MALLSEAERKKYFATLGLGEYNKDNILKLQKKYLLRRADWDGIYGTNTDNLLRHLKAVKDNCKNFAPQEFRCGCNGKYCSGYPTWMKPMELANIQAIRTHFGKPMTVTCGVRCAKYNSIVGGISDSEHKKGLAVDYYISGVTDTLANRKKSIKWIQTLPNHHYTYGNGIYAETVNGKTYTGSKSASGMGNALHTDSREGSPAPSPSPVTPDGKLVIDGVGGAATVKAMQRFFGTTQDGKISGQNKSCAKYYPAMKAVAYGKGGSPCIKNMQRWLGITQDGVWGQATSKALQKKLGVTADGIFGTKSMKAWQKYLNEHDKAVYPNPKPTPTPAAKTTQDKMIDYADKLINKGFKYVNYGKQKNCPICGGGKIFGSNCIGFVDQCMKHGGGIPVSCTASGIISDDFGNKLYASKDKMATWESRNNNKGCWQIIWNGGNKIPESMLQKGDIGFCYNGSKYKHSFIYRGGGKISDCSSGKGKAVTRNYSSLGNPCKIAVRWIGK